MKRRFIFLSIAAIAVVLGLLLGLGIGLTRNSSHSLDLDSDTPTPTGSLSTNSASPSSTTNKDIWTPSLNVTWDYHLKDIPDSVNATVRVYDIDLFDADTSDIELLHDEGHKVICYFSAGSYENWRPDKGNFSASDLGNNLSGWPGERWLNVTSQSVRSIMEARIDLASEKNCDGVDPDNIDGYDNDTGLELTENDAVDYVEFLSEYAHAQNLSIGLKNGGAIVDRVFNVTEWVVVEQCIQYDECEDYQPYVEEGKPVFNVEYPDRSSLSASGVSKYCNYKDSVGFMTILKNLDLDGWIESCPFREP